MKKLLSLIALFTAIWSCNTNTTEPDIKEPEKNEEKKTCVTSGYSDLTEISVKLFGYANLTSDMTGTIELGFVYSTEKTPSLENGVKVNTKEINSENQFSVTAKNLFSNTTYYYCAFIQRNGIYIYGDVKDFKTKEINVTVTTGEAKGIGTNSASLYLSCSFADAIVSPAQLISNSFFLYSNSTFDLDALINSGKRVEVDSLSSKASLKDLNSGTTYFYVAGYSIKGLTFPVYGEVKSFTTKNDDEGIVGSWHLERISMIHETVINGSVHKDSNVTDFTKENCRLVLSKSHSATAQFNFEVEIGVYSYDPETSTILFKNSLCVSDNGKSMVLVKDYTVEVDKTTLILAQEPHLGSEYFILEFRREK